MAGHSSPILPAPCPSAHLQTSKFSKQRRDCFHSLPSVRPAQWNLSRPCVPDAEDGPAASAVSTPGQHHRAWSLGSDQKSQDLESRRPRSPRQMAANERKLVRVPVSWPLRGPVGVTAKPIFSPSAALSGEPLAPEPGRALDDRWAADSTRRPKAHSTVVKTVNLEASLRLVPQANSTPTVIARAEDLSPAPPQRSRGEDVAASRSKKKTSRGSSERQSESERLGDVRWIDRGPVVSPTHAVVLRSPLKIWRKTSSVGEKEERKKDKSRQSAGRESQDSGVSVKAKTWNDEAAAGSDKAVRRRTAGTDCVNAVPLFLLLTVLCLLCLWGLHVLRANRGKNVAYSALGGGKRAPRRPGGAGVGDSLTVPPETDDSEAAVGARYRKGAQEDQDEDLERGGAVINSALSERGDSYSDHEEDGRLKQEGAIVNNALSGRDAGASDLTGDPGADAHGNTTVHLN